MLRNRTVVFPATAPRFFPRSYRGFFPRPHRGFYATAPRFSFIALSFIIKKGERLVNTIAAKSQGFGKSGSSCRLVVSLFASAAERLSSARFRISARRRRIRRFDSRSLLPVRPAAVFGAHPFYVIATSKIKSRPPGGIPLRAEIFRAP